MSQTGRQTLNISKVLCVIMGGGQGTRLFPLTKDRAKPAVPLAGKYRIVDIPDLELHQLALPPHLHFDAVQFHLAAQPHFADV